MERGIVKWREGRWSAGGATRNNKLAQAGSGRKSMAVPKQGGKWHTVRPHTHTQTHTLLCRNVRAGQEGTEGNKNKTKERNK